MKKIYLSIIAILFTFGLAAQAPQKNANQKYFDMNKSIDLFSSVLKELDMFYVDSIKVDSLVNVTIRQMLMRMDPYTEFYTEDNISELEFMTTGEYGGIGSIISQNKNRVVINEPYEGLPADKSGLKPGDIILAIDDMDMRDATVKEVSDKLKGTPGTSLRLTIQRFGQEEPLEIDVVRQKIEIDPIALSTMVNENTGYIHFSSFTNHSSNRIKESLLQLKKEGAENLVLDLRGNGGGILDEAVKTVNFFVDKGEEIVSTKGKVKQWDRIFFTQNTPIDTLMPIVVLIDTGSASASEIVAGAIQDLDRGVIVGSRSFGKGLVQTPRDLPYGSNIKITTSKYYIPSGRCIQALDYSHRNSDGSVIRVPDSLANTFYTRSGREVKDGGGINPDIVIKPAKSATITFYLHNENIVFNFVTEWASKHSSIAEPDAFEISDEDYEAFKEFVQKEDFEYDQMSIRQLESLEEVMKFEGYFDNASDEFTALQNKLKPDLNRDLELFKDEIKEMIESEIVKRYYYQAGAHKFLLKNDVVLHKALEILQDKSTYEAAFNGAATPEMDSEKDS